MRHRSLLGILVLSMLSAGCVSQQSFQSAVQQLERERQLNQQLQKQIDQLKAEAEKTKEVSTRLAAENQDLLKAAQENESRAGELSAQVKNLSREVRQTSKKKGPVTSGPDMVWAKGLSDEFQKKFRDELKGGTARFRISEDRLTFILADSLLFDPDDVDVTKEGENVLERLGEVLNKVKGREIVVGAHLDNVPIAPSMARDFPTAWEFTGTRAIEVVRYLEDESKIRGSLLTAAAYGSTRSVATNATEIGRAQNRRIEVTLAASYP